MIDLLVFTNGRDTIYETIPSAEAYLSGPISRRIIHDDSRDPANVAKLRRVFPDWEVWPSILEPGFGNAIRSAWQQLDDGGSASPYVFHLEDDFTFRRPVDLVEMMTVLARRPQLCQLALRRQPWNAAEMAAGGVVEQHPDDWTDQRDPALDLEWIESRLNFTTNPNLYRSSLLDYGWPEGPESEGRFSIGLLESDPALVFGYWGSRDSGEWVTHIGNVRTGTGY